ncbi:MAG: glycosyl hydrolase [Phycisphaerae bacterium]
MNIDYDLKPVDLAELLKRFWELSAQKIRLIDDQYDVSRGSPVFTVQGQYTTRGWTEWTQGFEFGAAVLQFDATGDEEFLEYARRNTVEKMAPHVTSFGVHDHGFNNVSTYGNLLRLMSEGKIPENAWERNFHELALKASGAVQARRWTALPEDCGYIYSFNGPHSLFVDTIRSCRALAVSHCLGHVMQGENDVEINLYGRVVKHARSTSRYNIYFGYGRDAYDVPGRTVHEAIFNTNDGSFRCPSSQQGFSPFTTWTRGLSWAMLGFPEQLEFLDVLSEDELEQFGGREELTDLYLRAAEATCRFYIANTPTDGIPYWDTGAPNLYRLGEDYLNRPSDPYNDCEPIDSSAAAIGCQGLLRLGHWLKTHGREENGTEFFQAGLTALRTLLEEPYLSTNESHQGLILHSVYHRPNGWDYIPDGSAIPNGESSMWGDYHAREAALYVHRLINGEPYLTFWPGKSRQ